MTYEELKDNPDIKWTEEPIIGTAILLGDKDLMDSYADPIHPRVKYWVGKHLNGFLIIFPAVRESIENFLVKENRLN